MLIKSKIATHLIAIIVWTVSTSRMGCFDWQKKMTPPAPATTAEETYQPADRKFAAPLLWGTPDTLPFLALDPPFLTALLHQENYLRRGSTPRQLGAGFHKKELLSVLHTLKQQPFFYSMRTLAGQIDFYQLKTFDKDNKVRVTGYYTPRLEVRKTCDETFCYPLLRMPPPGYQMPTLAQLRGYALPDSLTAIAWAKSEKEVENAQLQGSCLLIYPDGKNQFLGFGGSLILPGGGKYVFFTEVKDKVLGAGSFPMTAGYSLALDPKVAPIGSTIFAELPRLSPSGQLKGYDYRIMFVQDRGGAIKTTRRVDVYAGIGREGLQAARKINGFGRFWVMLPKQQRH